MDAYHLGELVRSLVQLSESRGKEAAGVAIRDDATLHVYKEANRGTAFLTTATYAHLTKDVLSNDTLQRTSVALIGHTRLVTNGSMERHENNQPVIRGGIVGIHNGIIVNDADLFARHGVQRTCDVDTEALLALVEQRCAAGSTVESAVGDAFGELRGTASVALLFHDCPILLLATNNGSLYTLSTPWGCIFASERYTLEQVAERHGTVLGLADERIAHLTPGTGMVVRLEDGQLQPFPLERCTGVTRRMGSGLALKDWPSERTAPPQMVRNDLTDERLAHYRRIHDEHAAAIAAVRRCSRCILPATMPFIDFDAAGVCTYCRHHVPRTHLGEDALRAAVEPLRGDGRSPDCLFPLSGGRDSSYGLHYVKTVLKLTPIAYSYDWGMLTDLGRRNQARMCGALGVEHLLISADIEKKRRFIRQNVTAWLRRPDLGTVPLFMAGDKQYFYYLNRLKEQVRTGLSVYCENPLEQTNFKYGFCGVEPKFDNNHVYKIGLRKKLALAFYYAAHYARNPGLLNASLTDTIGAFFATYVLPHNYLYLYRYIPWDEEAINRTLREQYDWELADDTSTTWRIGDGTAAFYNYIYYTVAGLTENDTFRSNQVREGLLTREEALRLSRVENEPRFPSLVWYGDTIGIDIFAALDAINALPKRYADPALRAT